MSSLTVFVLLVVMSGVKGIHRVAQDCAELYINRFKQSGVYSIVTNRDKLLEVYCDMDTDGGGWTVFQKRFDGTVSFYRGWDEYAKGFGRLDHEFWLGNDALYYLTLYGERKYELRIDLWDKDDNTRYAKYDEFSIASNRTKFKLTLGSYSGNAGDSLSAHNGQYFSTNDDDNDAHTSQNCAELHDGAWWYDQCHFSNLNGLYHTPGPYTYSVGYANGVVWNAWHQLQYSLKKTEMKIRPVGFAR